MQASGVDACLSSHATAQDVGESARRARLSETMFTEFESRLRRAVSYNNIILHDVVHVAALPLNSHWELFGKSVV